MSNATDKIHPGFLKVKGRFDTSEQRKLYVKKLSSALYQCISNHGYAEMRAIGRDACYNAVCSLIRVNGTLAQQGTELYWNAAFDNGNLGDLQSDGHVQDVTAVKFYVKDFTAVQMKAFKREAEESK